MTASRLRDLVATDLRKRADDVADVTLYPSVFADRLGLNVLDVDGSRWRVHFLKDAWQSADDEHEAEQ